jgi:hypothetical protein
MVINGRYHIEHVRDGKVIWTDDFDNLVVNTGKAEILDKFFAGSSYTAAVFLGLITGGIAATAISAADTAASHAGWTESSAYSAGTRPAPSWNAATGTGGGSNSAGTGSARPRLLLHLPLTAQSRWVASPCGPTAPRAARPAFSSRLACSLVVTAPL